MDVKWFKLRSWHIYAGVADTGLARAYCGRTAQRPLEDDRPTNAKTCEICLRIAGPR